MRVQFRAVCLLPDQQWSSELTQVKTRSGRLAVMDGVVDHQEVVAALCQLTVVSKDHRETGERTVKFANVNERDRGSGPSCGPLSVRLSGGRGSRGGGDGCHVDIIWSATV